MITKEEFNKAKNLENEIKNINHIIMMLENKFVFNTKTDSDANERAIKALENLNERNLKLFNKIVKDDD